MRRAWVLVGCLACGDSGGDAPADAAPDGGEARCEDKAPWATRPDLPLGATQETAVVAAGGKVFVLGGFNGAMGIVAAVQIFDPATCSWSMGPELPKPVHHANAAVVGTTLFVLGSLETVNFTAIGDVWSYDPAVDTAWQPRAAMPAGTQRGSSVTGTIDGKIYVAGGLRNGAVAELSVFDPGTNMWTTGLPALPMSRDHACGGVIDGKLYVAGGRQATITSQSPFVYEYTPGGSWVEKAAMPTARGGTACGVVGDRLIVVGGEGNAGSPTGVFPQAEVYDASDNAWSALEPMPVPRHGMGAAVVGDKLYVPGGATRQGFGAVATHDVLSP